MGSTYGWWSILTGQPTAACVRACCSALESRDSAATVRAHSRQQGEATLLIHYTCAGGDMRFTLYQYTLHFVSVSAVSYVKYGKCLTLNPPTPPGCKYIVHSQCANKDPEPCARTFVKSKQEIGVRNTIIAFHFLFLSLVCLYFCFSDYKSIYILC